RKRVNAYETSQLQWRFTVAGYGNGKNSITLYAGLVLAMIAMLIPQISFLLYSPSMENIFMFLCVFGISVRLFTAHFAEDKEYTVQLKIMVYTSVGVGVHHAIPIMCPIILDSMNLLDQPRPRMFILNGDYLVDKYEYYFQIHSLEINAIFLTVCILCAPDPMYAESKSTGFFDTFPTCVYTTTPKSSITRLS
ncbi:hypothetical protein TSAR_011574, partial [Trichomalopsis sarcophagae]